MKDTLINDYLLEEIRTTRTTSKWQDENCEQIVEFGYTHEYLLANRSVDDIIIDFYIKSIKDIYTTDEWQDFENSEKKNKNYITNSCSFLIEGAFHNRVNLWVKMGTLLELRNELNLNNKYKHLSDLKPYFKNYASDFKSGYNQFLNVVVKPYLLFDYSKEEAAHIIFRYITNDQSNAPVVTLIKGFEISLKNGKYDLNYEFKDGLNEGYLYKAWSLIFSQNELFLPLFQKYIADGEMKKSIKHKITIDQIALKYVYEGVSITRNNCNLEIKKYGLKSGEKLYQRFTYYSSRANRKGIPLNCTPKKLENKIKLIENVIEMLPDECKEQALDEVKILIIKAKNNDY
ncbi:hypothetical protein [Formosa algae]|uniref:hypothetical protein n=1 Tax=Formosa algae TaxID=225843 RepID=UPI0011AF0831|nr:hypothetical protein [Formosa algae]